MSEEIYVLEVEKCRDKVRIAKNQAELGLAKDIKINGKQFSNYISKNK